MDGDVDLPGADTHDWAVLLVQSDYLEGVLPGEDDVVVKLVILRQGRESRPGNVSNRTEPESLVGEHGSIDEPDASEDATDLGHGQRSQEILYRHDFRVQANCSSSLLGTER